MAYWLLLFPIIDLSAGTCMNLTIVGGSTLNMFVQMLCEAIGISRPLTTVEWYLLFTCGTLVLSQIPNLNSLGSVSLIGAAISSVSYCTLLWVVPVKEVGCPTYYTIHQCKRARKFLGFWVLLMRLGSLLWPLEVTILY